MAKDPVPNELEKMLSANLEKPSFAEKGDISGTEDIGRDDITLPRLTLAQSLSPELDEMKPGSYIEGLKLGDMFNTLTREVYGKGPLSVCVLRLSRPRWVEFIPRERGGGIKDPNVPPNDPRAQFGPNGEMPLATKFYDFIISLLPINVENPMERIVSMSLKSTQLKIARQWNGLIKMRNKPVYYGNYTIMSVDEQNTKGKYKNFAVRNAGEVKDKADYEVRKSLYEALRVLDVTIDMTSETNDSDVSFPPVPGPGEEDGEKISM